MIPKCWVADGILHSVSAFAFLLYLSRSTKLRVVYVCENRADIEPPRGGRAGAGMGQAAAPYQDAQGLGRHAAPLRHHLRWAVVPATTESIL